MVAVGRAFLCYVVKLDCSGVNEVAEPDRPCRTVRTCSARWVKRRQPILRPPFVPLPFGFVSNSGCTPPAITREAARWHEESVVYNLTFWAHALQTSMRSPESIYYGANETSMQHPVDDASKKTKLFVISAAVEPNPHSMYEMCTVPKDYHP